jgi:general secretion pathway protein G
MLRNTQRGFTLIELMVVIAIIGLLSAAILSSLSTANQRGRDANRIADMKQLQNALELYAADNGGGSEPIRQGGISGTWEC